MDVIVLNGVVNDPEVPALGPAAQAALERANQAPDPQRRHVLADPDRDQSRQPTREFLAPAM
jgi:hypothetical protein